MIAPAAEVAPEVLEIIKNRNPAEKFAALRASAHPQAQFLWVNQQEAPEVVLKAVRLVLREHAARQAHHTTPIGEKVITTVRDFIDRNANRFPALAMFGRSDQAMSWATPKAAAVRWFICSCLECWRPF